MNKTRRSFWTAAGLAWAAAMPAAGEGVVSAGEPVVEASASQGAAADSGSRQELVNMGRDALGPLSVMIHASRPRVERAAERARALSEALGQDAGKEWPDAPGFAQDIRLFKEYFDRPEAGIKLVLNQAANRAPRAAACVTKLIGDPALPRSRKQLGCLLSSRLVLTAYRKVIIERAPRARILLAKLESRSEGSEARTAARRHRALFKEMMSELKVLPYDALPEDQKAFLRGLKPSADRIQKEIQGRLKEKAKGEMAQVVKKSGTLAETGGLEPRKLKIRQGVAVNVVVHQSLNVALALSEPKDKEKERGGGAR